jgi:hypothetical protein
MLKSRLVLAGFVVAAGLGVSACATDGYYGGGYGGYYGSSYYDYDGGYWDDGGLYYAPSYYGWYGDYYYPGSGIYVYDRNHNRHRWNDSQRRYWQNRGSNWHGQRPGGNGNWDRFPHHPVPHQGSGSPQGGNGGHWNGGGNSGNGHWNGGGHSGSGHSGGGHRGHH